MKEKDIIKNLKMMKEITPDSEWVLKNKRALLGEEESFSIISEIRDLFNNIIFAYKFVSVLIVAVFSFTSIVVYAQNSLPGDALYSVKRATEKAQFAFRQGDDVTLNFEIAQRRLAELDRAVSNSSPKNLNPAIEEFQAIVSEASKKAMLSEDINLIAEEIKKIEEGKKRMGSLEIENEDFNKLKIRIACKRTEDLISFTETRTLTERQEELFEDAIKHYEEGECYKAEEIILVDFKEIEEDKSIASEEEVKIASEEEVGIASEPEDIGIASEEKFVTTTDEE